MCSIINSGRLRQIINREEDSGLYVSAQRLDRLGRLRLAEQRVGQHVGRAFSVLVEHVAVVHLAQVALCEADEQLPNFGVDFDALGPQEAFEESAHDLEVHLLARSFDLAEVFDDVLPVFVYGSDCTVELVGELVAGVGSSVGVEDDVLEVLGLDGHFDALESLEPLLLVDEAIASLVEVVEEVFGDCEGGDGFGGAAVELADHFLEVFEGELAGAVLVPLAEGVFGREHVDVHHVFDRVQALASAVEDAPVGGAGQSRLPLFHAADEVAVADPAVVAHRRRVEQVVDLLRGQADVQLADGFLELQVGHSAALGDVDLGEDFLEAFVAGLEVLAEDGDDVGDVWLDGLGLGEVGLGLLEGRAG